MQDSFYVGLSAQIALQRRLESIAHNVANLSTTGFRAEQVRFETLVSTTGKHPVAYATGGEAYLSQRPGEIVRTENPLDVAVEGDAWLAIQTPIGLVHTRDGRMRMSDTGELMSITGHPILDAGGAPILLDPAAGPPQIARDGMITQKARQIGAIGLFTIPAGAKISRFENSGVVSEPAGSPALDFSATGLLQGHIERANVNPMLEVSRLMLISRSFEAVASSLNDSESTLREAIRTLGGNS